MNYEETLEFLYKQLPMYQRQGAAAFKKDLSNTIDLCNAVGNPQNNYPTIHIAGTNGKGSVSHIIAAILKQAGYKVGLYTSPHYKDFRERIKVNAEYIPQKAVVEFIESNKAVIEKIQPSFFEMTVALAFKYFNDEQVDMAVIETGLGGRLDSTNIVTPDLSVITNIGYDHQQFLGDTLPLIAAEKAGIIKPRIPVLIGEYQQEVAQVFEEQAYKLEAPLNFADDRFEFKLHNQNTDGMEFSILEEGEVWFDHISSDLFGSYQSKNILTAVVAIRKLQNKGWTIADEDIINGLLAIRNYSGLMGRLQVLNNSPQIIADSAHNVAGIEELLRFLEQCNYENLHIVYGAVNDKDLNTILSRLPKKAKYYFSKPDISRGKDAAELQTEALKYKLTGNRYNSVSEALKQAKSIAKPNDLVLITGSIFVVGEVL